MMLGRNANSIFWMFRYLERAENTARLLEAGFRMAMTRDEFTSQEEWRSVIQTAGMRRAYEAEHGTYTGIQAWNFVLRDRKNPQSVLSMVENVRTNARAVRNMISRELWETINESWMEVRDLLSSPVQQTQLGDVINAIRREATLVRGAMEGSMLRTDVFNFARIGGFIERADNTARILDVKYYLLLPTLSHVGGSLDNIQWDSVLRSVGGDRAYRWLNHVGVEAKSLADFLILDRRFPRSLAFAYGKIRSNMANLAEAYGEETDAHILLRDIDTRLSDLSVGEIIDEGLHQFILGFLSDNQRLADAIARDYRFIE
jgi:uncharacterized alpha-E superfamily protein